MTLPQLPAEPQPEPDATPSSAPPAASTPDRWSTWFSRAMQLVGLCMVVFQQATYKSDPWLLLIAAGMMLGGLGLQLIVKTISNVTGGQVGGPP